MIPEPCDIIRPHGRISGKVISHAEYIRPHGRIRKEVTIPFVTFHPLRDLSPPAFKLYVYFLDRVQAKNTAVFSVPMVHLGYESGLQPECFHPAFRHGNDRQLRNALEELIDQGLIEKQGHRGRAPNTYTVLEHQLHIHPNA